MKQACFAQLFANVVENVHAVLENEVTSKLSLCLILVVLIFAKTCALCSY